MSRFQKFPSGAARQIAAADLDAIFDTVDVGRGIPKGRFGGQGWLEAEIGATEAIGQLVSLSTIGGAGIILGSRTSDQAGPSMGCFAIGAFAVNDSTTAGNGASAGYFETRRHHATGQGLGIEVVVCNIGTDVVARDPYAINFLTDTFAISIDAGRSDIPNSQDATVGLHLIGSYAGPGTRDVRLLSGITFDPRSLRLAAGGGHVVTGTRAVYGAAVAIDLCSSQSITFRSPVDGGIAGYIRADIGVAGACGAITFTTGGIILAGPAFGAPMTVADNLITTTNLAVAGNQTVSGSIDVQGALGVKTSCRFFGKVSGALTPRAGNADAVSSGLVSGDWYYNTSIAAISIVI